ncbi:Transcriptional regulatory protein YehT [Pontiella desulfatans]|uniref:Transcriptional regulatory protein YehT n=1 Tax=Pontiella desulfatans TaxID=2750659 RepID=A0A6C2UC80_PONDE|nr:LytTR family DNA-binding domain-containing protein [Pontiella desulfatans]VGO17483.1 Transcriptional regulatory protein YehT [Pontiella desulfatans]
MKVIIIEDNIVDMENLKILLGKFGDHELVGTAETIEKGMDLAAQLRPDIILSDIQLGREVSLDHLRKLDYSPHIICTTLYESHALRAYEVGAIDYLLKPVTEEKLERAFRRVPNPRPKKSTGNGIILLKIGNTTRISQINEIIQVTADRDYTTILDDNGTHPLCNRRMHEWLELLPHEQFVSLDRSTIINVKKISAFSRLNHSNKAQIVLLNGDILEIGPTALGRLQQIFQ